MQTSCIYIIPEVLTKLAGSYTIYSSTWWWWYWTYLMLHWWVRIWINKSYDKWKVNGSLSTCIILKIHRYDYSYINCILSTFSAYAINQSDFQSTIFSSHTHYTLPFALQNCTQGPHYVYFLQPLIHSESTLNNSPNSRSDIYIYNKNADWPTFIHYIESKLHTFIIHHFSTLNYTNSYFINTTSQVSKKHDHKDTESNITQTSPDKLQTS